MNGSSGGSPAGFNGTSMLASAASGQPGTGGTPLYSLLPRHYRVEPDSSKESVRESQWDWEVGELFMSHDVATTLAAPGWTADPDNAWRLDVGRIGPSVLGVLSHPKKSCVWICENWIAMGPNRLVALEADQPQVIAVSA